MGARGGKKGPEDAGLGGKGAERTEAGIGGVHMAYADHVREGEADAVDLLVGEWTKNGVLGQGTKEIRELIKQFNEVTDAVAWRPAASKVSATNQSGDEAENQATIAWRLARQLLCLHRLGTTNMEAYEASIDAEAIWTKRVGMEMLMRGKKLPEDKEAADAAIKAGGSWFVVCPDTIGSKDEFGGAQAGGQGEGAQGSVGKGKKVAETPLKNPNWARRGPGAGGDKSEGNDEKGSKKRKERNDEKGDGEKGDERKGARADLPEEQGLQLCWCDEHTEPVGFGKGSRCPVCAAQEAAQQQRRPTLYSCEKHESKVWFRGSCPMSAVVEPQGTGMTGGARGHRAR